MNFKEKKYWKSNTVFFSKPITFVARIFQGTLLIFALISLGFSAIGGMFPDSEHTSIIGNPLVVSGITAEHVMGHVFWGAVIALGTLSIRYIILGGSFGILLSRLF